MHDETYIRQGWGFYMKKYSRRIKLKDLPEEERPRERIMRFGPDALSNQELMAAILSAGNRRETVLDISRRLLSKHNLEDLSQITVTELKRIFGVSNAKACQLVAAVELGKRIAVYAMKRKKVIKTVDDIAKIFMPRMKGLKREVLKGLYLDSKLHPLKEETISMGGLNTNSVQPYDVFRTAISEAAAALILIHNHPSGDPEPSKRDIIVTKKLIKAGELLGIKVLDHIIIGNNCYTSLKESGLF